MNCIGDCGLRNNREIFLTAETFLNIRQMPNKLGASLCPTESLNKPENIAALDGLRAALRDPDAHSQACKYHAAYQTTKSKGSLAQGEEARRGQTELLRHRAKLRLTGAAAVMLTFIVKVTVDQ